MSSEPKHCRLLHGGGHELEPHREGWVEAILGGKHTEDFGSKMQEISRNHQIIS